MTEDRQVVTLPFCPCGTMVVRPWPEHGDPEQDWYCPGEDDVLLRGEVRLVEYVPKSRAEAAEPEALHLTREEAEAVRFSRRSSEARISANRKLDAFLDREDTER